MSQNTKLALALGVLAVAGGLTVRALWAPVEGDERPEESFWLCRNPDCGAELVLPFDQIAEDLAEGRQPECTECGERRTSRAVGCPHCKRPYPPVGHSGVREICPHCGEKYFQDDEGAAPEEGEDGEEEWWPDEQLGP